MFEYAGSLVGTAPIVRPFLISETCYVGQLCSTGLTAHAGGAVQIADAAGAAHEDATPIVGIVAAVRNLEDAGYNSTYKGETATYDTAQADLVANDPIGPCEVDVILCLPGITLIRGPIWNATDGTAITELTETTGSADGSTVTHANDTAIDYADSLNAICYCRKGANAGQYRYISAPQTGSQTLHVCFSYDIAIGDVFVTAPFGPGPGCLQIPAGANFIDASGALSAYFDIFCIDLDLSEKGKERAVFTLCASCSAFGGGISYLAG
jgi:hypothetical protein